MAVLEVLFSSCVRGFHVYQDRWTPVLDETLVCQREIENPHDPFAVKVTKSGNIVGHLPKKISSTCSLFLRRGGTLTCKVTNPSKRYSRDLEQGGLEIPCVIIFRGEQELLDKVKRLLSFINGKTPSATEAGAAPKIKQEPGEEANNIILHPPEAKRVKVEHVDELNYSGTSREVWATCTGTRIKLYRDDKLLLEGNHRLNDKHINFAQAILRVQFPQYDGLQNTLIQGRCEFSITNPMVQILHIRDDHWAVISNLRANKNELKFYDTVYDDIDKDTMAMLYRIFDDKITITVDTQLQKQEGGVDCGVFCIAVATSLLHGIFPGKYKQSHLRSHLVCCIANGMMEPFP